MSSVASCKTSPVPLAKQIFFSKAVQKITRRALGGAHIKDNDKALPKP